MKRKLLFIMTLLLLITGLFTACNKKKEVKEEGVYYTCPMHRDVKVDHPGECPICKMALIPIYAEAATIQATAAPMSCCGAPAPASKP